MRRCAKLKWVNRFLIVFQFIWILPAIFWQILQNSAKRWNFWDIDTNLVNKKVLYYKVFHNFQNNYSPIPLPIATNWILWFSDDFGGGGEGLINKLDIRVNFTDDPISAGNCLLKVNNESTWTMGDDAILVSLFLTFNRFQTLFWCFHC